MPHIFASQPGAARASLGKVYFVPPWPRCALVTAILDRFLWLKQIFKAMLVVMRLKLVRAIRAICVLLALCFMNFGCGPNANRATKYGVDANPMRERVGLPILPTNWVLYGGSRRTVLTWFNPDSRRLLAKGQPSRASKEVEVNRDKVVSETDTYWSGRVVMADEQKIEESMVVTYSFDLARKEKSPWSCFMPCGGGACAFAQAVEKLKEWGIPAEQRPR